MPHPSQTDLDELEAALAGPDLETLDEHSETFLRALRSLRRTFEVYEIFIAEEDARSTEEDIE